MIEPGLHLGYRRLGGRPGTWSVRRYLGDSSYHLEVLKGVVADDYQDSDGHTVLSFAEAQKRALETKPKPGDYTVGNAIAAFLAETEHKRSGYDNGVTARAHILPKLADVRLGELTTERLKRWRDELAKAPARKRSPKGTQAHYEHADTPENRRRRQATANRIWAVLRAALNQAWRDGHVASAEAWKKVQPFKGAVSARARFLSVEEARRLINACDEHFRPLVQAALATGCRYGELGRLKAGEVNLTVGTVHIETSKSGKPRDVALNAEGVALFKVLCAGRAPGDLLFRMSTDSAWTRARQGEPMKLACENARISPPIGFHGLRHTWASLAVMGGMPLPVVARNLGHASTAMVEKHYGHLSPDYIAEQVRKSAPTFGFEIDKKVAALLG